MLIDKPLVAKNLERLVKILELTRSDNDFEALAALRQANKIVPNWGALLRGTEARSKLGEAYRKKPAQPIRREAYRPLISEMLQECLESVGEADLDYVRKLSTQFSAKGYLSPKQAVALTRIYEKL